MNNRRMAVAGALIAIGYLLVAGMTFRRGLLPVRPFFEGTAPPQPYKWVKVPEDAFFSGSIEGAEAGTGTVKLSEAGSEAATMSSIDGQALLSVYQGSIKPVPGESSVTVTITPLDPAKVGRAPDGLSYDSNAYEFEAVYAGSGQPAQLAAESCVPDQQPKLCPTVVMRYARGARALYIREGSSWSELSVSLAHSSLQIYGDISQLGTFAAAGRFSTPAPPGPPIARYVALGLAALSALAAGLIGGTERGRRWVRRNWRKAQRWLKGGAAPARRKPATKGKVGPKRNQPKKGKPKKGRH